MKKIIYVGTAVGVLSFGGIVFANTDLADQETNRITKQPSVTVNQNAFDAEKELLSFKEASEKALDIANGTITDIELDDDNNRPHYEIDIYHEGYEYELKLDAVSGKVLQQKREKDDKDDAVRKSTAAGGLISSAEAVEAARTVAKGRVIEVSLDDDDDEVAIYEIELKDGNTEHEVSVNAVNGTILEHERDNDNDDNDDDDYEDDNDDD